MSAVTVVPAFGGAQFSPSPENHEIEHEENPTDSPMMTGVLSALGFGALAHFLEATNAASEFTNNGGPSGAGGFTAPNPKKAMDPSRSFVA